MQKKFDTIHFEMFVPLSVNESEKRKQIIEEFIETLETKLMYEADVEVLIDDPNFRFKIYVTLQTMKYVSYVISELRKVNYKLSSFNINIDSKLTFGDF